MGRVKRIWYLSPMRAAKVQASLRIRAVSPEPPLLAHTSSESRGTFRQKARSLAPLNGWACAVNICHDGMLEDTNSLDAVHIIFGKPAKISLTQVLSKKKLKWFGVRQPKRPKLKIFLKIKRQPFLVFGNSVWVHVNHKIPFILLKLWLFSTHYCRLCIPLHKLF